MYITPSSELTMAGLTLNNLVELRRALCLQRSHRVTSPTTLDRSLFNGCDAMYDTWAIDGDPEVDVLFAYALIALEAPGHLQYSWWPYRGAIRGPGLL